MSLLSWLERACSYSSWYSKLTVERCLIKGVLLNKRKLFVFLFDISVLGPCLETTKNFNVNVYFLKCTALIMKVTEKSPV